MRGRGVLVKICNFAVVCRLLPRDEMWSRPKFTVLYGAQCIAYTPNLAIIAAFLLAVVSLPVDGLQGY